MNFSAEQLAARRPPLQVVVVQRPRCPRCRSSHLRAYGTHTYGLTVVRHTRCKTCGTPFRLILQ